MTDNTLRNAIARAIRGADPVPIGNSIQYEAVVFPLQAADAVLAVLADPPAEVVEPLTSSPRHAPEELRALPEAPLHPNMRPRRPVQMPQEREQKMTPEELERWERLTHTLRKLSAWNGYDIGDLIADGYLEEGDLSD